MKIYTSYFYGIRFFKPNMIPLSTAVFDPKWFHQGKGNQHWFVDKNGVINGLRAEVFAPGEEAGKYCRGRENCATQNPKICQFLLTYRKQLNQLDFNDIMTRIERICEQVRQETHFVGEPIAVFIVHEAPDNPCSERGIIQQWFRANGVEIEELDLHNLKGD